MRNMNVRTARLAALPMFALVLGTIALSSIGAAR
jgi:hypothetical protein